MPSCHVEDQLTGEGELANHFLAGSPASTWARSHVSVHASAESCLHITSGSIRRLYSGLLQTPQNVPHTNQFSKAQKSHKISNRREPLLPDVGCWWEEKKSQHYCIDGSGEWGASLFLFRWSIHEKHGAVCWYPGLGARVPCFNLALPLPSTVILG